MSIYAVSDMHGCADVYHKIKKIIKPEDTVYCLGDCGDRGPQPWETIKLVASDPQFIYLKGNHEDMLVKAAREAMNDEGWGFEHQELLMFNGGLDTLNGLLAEDRPEIWISMLAKLPTYTTYINANGKKVFLSHAGCNIWADDSDVLPSDKELIWDRLHYFNTKGSLIADIVIVHGHTPIVHLVEDIGIKEPDEWVALEYCDGKKYCIDQGTVFSGHSTLLNLDTFESIDISLND